MVKKKLLHINQILNLIVDRFGKDGDFIFMYQKFIIFLKSEKGLSITLNDFVKIRITKILPTFALAVLVSDSVQETSP